MGAVGFGKVLPLLAFASLGIPEAACLPETWALGTGGLLGVCVLLALAPAPLVKPSVVRGVVPMMSSGRVLALHHAGLYSFEACPLLRVGT